MATFISIADLPALNLMPHTGQVYLLPIDLKVSDEQLLELREDLTPAEQAAAQDFYFERDCRRYTAGRAGLRRALAALLNIEPRAVEFWYGALGKPGLANRGAGWLQFNFSHSGDLALLALTAQCPVGVDVECVRRVADMLTLAERFFAPAEVAALQDCAPDERPKLFFRLWTCKEAFLKATGTGLQQPLNSITVQLAADGRTGYFTDAAGDKLPYSLTTLDLPTGYAGALALPD